MKVSYENLWIILKDRDMKKTDLIKNTNISPNTLSKLSKNEFVKLETIGKIAIYLGVQISDLAYVYSGSEVKNEKV